MKSSQTSYENPNDSIDLATTGQCFRIPPAEWFNKDIDWEAIKSELAAFPELVKPIAAAPGMQILKQPFVECTISFIVSANNNIKRFTKTLEQMQFNLEWLETQTEQYFRDIGCGYRAPYLVEAVRRLKELSFIKLESMPDDSLYKELRTIKGVGDKVARCIMLFCFQRLNIVPVDTWIEKVYNKIYKDNISADKKLTPKYMAEQLQNRWGRYAGVAQQYMFYYTQHLHKEL